MTAKPHPWVPGCLELTGAGDLTTLEPFRTGKLLVQDPAARLVSLIAGVQPGQKVLDLCAAPGGKSFSAAFAMEDKGEIVSCDLITEHNFPDTTRKRPRYQAVFSITHY